MTRVISDLAVHKVASLPAPSAANRGRLLCDSAGLHYCTGTAWLRLDFGTSQTANRFFASPDGAPGTPSFRALSANDVPSLPASKIGSGTLDTARGGTGFTTPLTANRFLLTGDSTTIIQADAGQAKAALGLADSGWQNAALQNSWGSYANGYAVPGYRKVGSQVFLRGACKSGVNSSGTVIFTLPAGYRPANNLFLLASQFNGVSELRCNLNLGSTSGDVVIYFSGTTDFLSFDNISFFVD